MAVTANAPPVIVPELEYATLPQADRDPLFTTLKNANGLYESHAPALISALYTCEAAIVVRSAVFQIPLLPSADTLDYNFSHWIYGDAGGAGTMTVLVEEWTGAAWNTLENTAGIAAAASTMVRHDHTDPIDPNATILRITLTRATDPMSPCAILVRPGTNAPAAGTYPSGFVPFDDGLLNVGTNDAGINTEHLNRGPQMAMAVLKDRRQCVWSFVQEEGLTNTRYFAEDSATLSAGLPVRFGLAVGSIPNQVDPKVTVLAIGSVDAGATANLIRVWQVDGPGVSLDADGAVQSGELTLALKDPGGLDARFAMEITGEIGAGGTSMTINAVIVLWRPGD